MNIRLCKVTYNDQQSDMIEMIPVLRYLSGARTVFEEHPTRQEYTYLMQWNLSYLNPIVLWQLQKCSDTK